MGTLKFGTNISIHTVGKKLNRDRRSRDPYTILRSQIPPTFDPSTSYGYGTNLNNLEKLTLIGRRRDPEMQSDDPGIYDNEYELGEKIGFYHSAWKEYDKLRYQVCSLMLTAISDNITNLPDSCFKMNDFKFGIRCFSSTYKYTLKDDNFSIDYL